MHLLGDFSESLIPIMIFSLPILGIVGGITAGIVKTMSQSRLIENAQRERIAAIQAGIDPSKLPPMPALGEFADAAEVIADPDFSARRLSQGLMIGGIVTLFAGVGLGLFLWIIEDSGRTWSVGLMPAFVGIALLISSFLVRPARRS